MADDHRWWLNGAAFPWRGTSRHGPSTTTPPASGAAAGQSWFNGFWPRSANYADPGSKSRCITFGPSKISTPKGRNIRPNGSRGWLLATARPWSSAASAMRTSTPDVPHGSHDKHWRAGCHGNRARPVRRGAVGKGPGQLAPRRRLTLRHAPFCGSPGVRFPGATRHCKDANRRGDYEHTSFDFLGYTFRTRKALGKRGYFASFNPAISASAKKA